LNKLPHISSARYPNSRGLLLVAGGVVLMSLTACAVGPDFQSPGAPVVKQYTHESLPAQLSAGTKEPLQNLAVGESIGQQWWQLYHSARLNALVTETIAQNPNLEAARASLLQAQQILRQTSGGYLPRLDLNASAQRRGGNSVSSVSGGTINLYSVGASVSYDLDLFGANRRRVEQAAALVDKQHFQLAAAYLALTGNAVNQAIDIAAIRLQLKAVQDIIKDDEHNLKLVQLKFQAGKAAQKDVLTAQSQLANDRVQLPPLKQQLSVARHALAVLAGKFPAQWSSPDFELTEFTLPTSLPISVPSSLVRQRPDILAAEAQLHADSAAIGIAASQLYPNIQLSASLGYDSLTSANLFQTSNRFWNVVAGLTAPIFHGGELAAQKQAAVYAFQASAANYRQTVLNAFAQVADLLRALEHDAELVAAQKHALDTSFESLRLQRLSYEAGKADLLQLLDAERAYQQAQLGYLRAQAQRYRDSTQLFLAMGGGWWRAGDLSAGPAGQYQDAKGAEPTSNSR